MSKIQFNFQLKDGQWATGGVGSNGSFYAKLQKGKREFLSEQQLLENVDAIKAAIAKRKDRSKTSDSAVAKELGALCAELLGDEAEG